MPPIFWKGSFGREFREFPVSAPFSTDFRQYIWGGRRLENSLGKCLPPGDGWAETWEIATTAPIRAWSPGTARRRPLGELVHQYGRELWGETSATAVPASCLKFLTPPNAVGPGPSRTTPGPRGFQPPDQERRKLGSFGGQAGKFDLRGPRIRLDRATLSEAIRQGRCQDCLHALTPSAGDCFFLPAGTVHALGAGCWWLKFSRQAM